MRVIEAFAQFFDGAGDPLVNGWLRFLESGTNNTDKATYADSAETVANTNPVQLDGEGRCPSVFGTGTYRVISFTNDELLNEPAEQIQMFDPVSGDPGDAAFSDWAATNVYDVNSIVTGSDGNYYRSLSNNNENNDPTTDSTNWEQIDFTYFYNANRTYLEGDRVRNAEGFEYFSKSDANTGNTPSENLDKWEKIGYTVESLVKTDDYTVLVADRDTQIILGSAAATDKIFTLPSVGASEDGIIYYFYNDSNYKLTIQPSNTDTVWNSGAGYGIEASHAGTYCTLRYDHLTTSWEPLQIGGGQWAVEGLKFWVKGTEITFLDPDSSTLYRTKDISDRHQVQVNNGIRVDVSGSSTYPQSFYTNGVDENLTAIDSADFDIGASASGDSTIFMRVYHTAIGSSEYYISQYETATDNWYFRKTGSDFIEFAFITSIGTDMTITATTDALSAGTWYNIAACKVDGDWGIYIGTGNTLTQVGYGDTWGLDSFAASLEVFSRNSAAYYNGRANDPIILNQNLFNAAPNSTPDDTITIPTNLNIVIGE